MRTTASSARTLFLSTLLALAAPAASVAQKPVPRPAEAKATSPGTFRWLEDVTAARSMAWVKDQDAKTMAGLGGSPMYAALEKRTLAVLDSRERLAEPTILGGRIYNYWQDAAHPRGLWRSTSWESYLSGSPQWRTVLDLDALAAAEQETWAWKGATCLAPEDRRCLVRLSRGGADAVQVREFDTQTGRFVAAGFRLPEAKQSVAWVGPDAIIVATDFGPGTMTTSGYPRIAKLWRRGTPLSSAKTLLEGKQADVSVDVDAWHTAERSYPIIMHTPSFFESEAYVLRGDSLVKLDIPLDADPHLVADRLVVYLRSPWTVGGATYPAGALVATGFEQFLEGARDFQTVLAPGPRATVADVRTTRDRLLVSMLEEVRPKLLRFRYAAGTWSADTVPLPDFGSVNVRATSPSMDRFFFTFASFTQPTTLELGEASGETREVKRLPAQFDASGLVAEQHEATSRDGTKIPYFIVHRKDMKLDGQNPTLQYGYGGFEISMTPSYNPVIGADWLERGGV